MGKDAKTDVELVAQARRGMGEEGDLMIDAGLAWDARTAIQRAKAFSDYNIFWLEEPLRPDDYAGYRKLSEATSLRIAAGEEESSRVSFLDLMDKGKIDVVQVDLYGSHEDREFGLRSGTDGSQPRVHNLHQRDGGSALAELRAECADRRIRCPRVNHFARNDYPPAIAGYG
jgi:hypothetical protein